MKKAKELFDICLSHGLNISLTWQKMTNFSIEIYRGYDKSYSAVFYSEGHIKSKNAIKAALKHMRNYKAVTR